MITIYLKQYNKIIRNADTKLFDELGYDDILWIDMLLPTIKEQKAVENFMEISLQTKQQVEEIESTSKYSESETAIISNSNFFVPTGDSFVVEPVSFIISNEGVLVSVRGAESRTFRETEKRLQMNYRSYSTGYHLFISLLEVRIDFDADMVELVSKQVAALSKAINSEDTIDKEVLHRISALQESTMSLRENIFDRQRVLSGILRSERFPNDIYPRLQLMIKDVNSLINHADFSFQRLDYIQDAALGLINIEQNEIVKIFSVAAVIFMPATLIASMYGMNFKFMPELDWVITLSSGRIIPMGYFFAIGLMLLCSGKLTWVPLYALILWLVWRRAGLRNMLLFAGLALLSVVLTDIVAGIFKHSGLLKNLLPDFQPRLRPMYHPRARRAGARGQAGRTVRHRLGPCRHDLLHRPAGFADPAPGLVLPCDGCLGGAGLLFAHLSGQALPHGPLLGYAGRRPARLGCVRAFPALRPAAKRRTGNSPKLKITPVRTSSDRG